MEQSEQLVIRKSGHIDEWFLFIEHSGFPGSGIHDSLSDRVRRKGREHDMPAIEDDDSLTPAADNR